MDSRWFSSIQDKEQRKKELLSYRSAYTALTEVLEKHLKKKEASREYNSPNWAYEQIAINEYNQVLMDVIKLINLKE